MSRRVPDPEPTPLDEPDYNDVHRAFLQAFLSQPVMTAEQIKPVLAAIMTARHPGRPIPAADITSQHISSTLQILNARLQALDYEIRTARDQKQRTHMYALVNTSSDTFTQLATRFDADEIAYIKRLLDCMFDENNNSVREVMAVRVKRAQQLASVADRNRVRRSQIASATATEGGNEDGEPSQGNTLTLSRSEAVIRQLLDAQFFTSDRINNGNLYYSLAPRALMELRAYLKETYNDIPEDADDEPVIRIKDCEGCREIVTVGMRCDNKECGIRWHEPCATQYFRGQSENAKQCPKCEARWSGESYVGPKADMVQARASGIGVD